MISHLSSLLSHGKQELRSVNPSLVHSWFLALRRFFLRFVLVYGRPCKYFCHVKPFLYVFVLTVMLKDENEFGSKLTRIWNCSKCSPPFRKHQLYLKLLKKMLPSPCCCGSQCNNVSVPIIYSLIMCPQQCGSLKTHSLTRYEEPDLNVLFRRKNLVSLPKWFSFIFCVNSGKTLVFFLSLI